MNFQDSIHALARQTEEIEVCATGSWDCKKCERDIGIRTGNANAGVEFHDPIIDGNVFMICGDIYEKGNYHRENIIEEVNEFGLDDIYVVKLRGVGGYPPYTATINLGEYKIEDMSRVIWDDLYSTACVLKLKLKRLNG